MRGSDVRTLQADLTKLGLATPDVGVFTKATADSVESFERQHGLKVNGVVNADFVTKLDSALQSLAQTGGAGLGAPGKAKVAKRAAKPRVKANPKISTSKKTPRIPAVPHDGGSAHLGERVLREGMSGHDVRVLQAFLTIAGYRTAVDGVLGPITEANVIRFERSHHFATDGVVSYAVAYELRVVVAEIDPSTTDPISTSPAPGGPVLRARLNSDGLVTAPASAPEAVKEVIAAANRIAFKPYIYGGGHASWYDSGYDCSGSVSFALHGAGLISAPEDSTEFESYGSPGAGRWISIWATGGHAYANIDGIWFDTAAQSSANGHDRWSNTRISPSAGFVERHPRGF